MKYSINIENPCSQDYSLMKDTYGGKFCSLCEKSVIDFTQLSDDETIRILKQKNFKVCGRLTERQMNRSLLESKRKNYFSSAFKIISGFLLLGATQKSIASTQQLTIQTYFTEVKPQFNKKNLNNRTQNDSLRIIKGTVISAEDSLPLPGATVIIEGTTIEVKTDLWGNFTIEISEHLLHRKKIVLVFSSIGHTIQKVKINPNKIPSKIKIKLIVEEMLLSGEVVIVKSRIHWWQFWRKKYKH